MGESGGLFITEQVSYMSQDFSGENSVSYLVSATLVNEVLLLLLHYK